MLKRSLALFAGILAASASFAAESNLTKLVAAFTSPTLGEAKQINQPLTIQISNLKLELLSGSAAPVIVDGVESGLFFSGKGRYSYHSTDPIETALVQYETKRFKRAAETGADGTTIHGEFENALIRSGGIELPKLTGAPGVSLQVAIPHHVEHFAATRWIPPAHLLVRQRLDNPTAKVAVVELTGDEDNAYVLDTIDRKEERFAALVTNRDYESIPAMRGAIFDMTLASQPVGRRRADFLQPRFLLRNIDYTVVEGAKGLMNLAIVETIVPRTDAQSVLRFNLERGVFTSDSDFKPLRIDSVTGDNGKPLAFHFEQDSVLVELPAKIPAGTQTTVRFEISGNILVHPDGDNYWQLGTSYWFPRPDLNGEFYTVHSVVKARKPFVPFAPGDTVARREEGDLNVVESTIDKPVQFTVAHAGKYAITDTKFDKLTVHVATYAGSNEAASKQLALLASQMIAYYEPFLGPFPFRELNIIEIPELGFGQAPPATMFITKEAFTPGLGTLNRVYSKGINQRFAHEIAHQYWGIVTKMGSWDEQWLTESFAEYVSSQIEKELKGPNGYNALLDFWRSDAKLASSYAPIPLANRIESFDEIAGLSRMRLLYGKGPYLLAVIHKTVGDQKFLSFLRNVQGRFAWRFLTTKDVIETLSKIDGKDWQPFFDRYFWGQEIPPMPR